MDSACWARSARNRRGALRLQSMHFALLVLSGTAGCPPVTSMEDSTLIVQNASGDVAVVVYKVNDQEYRELISAGEVRSIIIRCPSTLQLISATIGEGAFAEQRVLSDVAGSTLTASQNFVCGDRIDVELADTSTTWRTSPN